MLKIAFLLHALILFAAVGRAQSDEWHESENWRLYNVPAIRVKSIPLSELDRYKYRQLDETSMRGFMAHPTRMTPGKLPVWKNAYVATCELDEEKRKIVFSADGTFFFDEYAKAFYQIPPEVQKDWAAYLAACIRSLGPPR